MGSACGTYGGKEKCMQGLGYVGVEVEPEVYRPLERPRSTWENYIRTAMQECGLGLSTSG
jgi:hypothetical protein